MTRRDIEPLTTVTVGAIEPSPEGERWLVRSLWPASAVGLIAGTPKVCKTWLSIDLAVSVASGTSCLQHFPVDLPGPVLAFFAEDSLVRIHERIEGIARHRGLDLGRLRLHLITEPALRLDRAGDVERLFATVAALQPRLLLLDPFVRIQAINENDAGEVSAVLARLRQLQRAHDLAIALVHHARKNGARTGGESLRGSGDLYAWGDTYAYMYRSKDALRLVLEHRYEQPIAPVTLRMVNSDREPAHLELSASADPPSDPPLNDAILRCLTQAGAPLTRTVLRERLRVKNQCLGQALDTLVAAGVVERSPNGWSVPEHRSVPAL